MKNDWVSRRWPVYFLIDNSESAPFRFVEIINSSISLLKKEYNIANCRSELFISIISYGNKVKQVFPLTNLKDIDVPIITNQGIPKFEEGLTFLIDCMDKEVIISSKQIRGDCKPVIFIFISEIDTNTNLKNQLENVDLLHKNVILLANKSKITENSLKNDLILPLLILENYSEEKIIKDLVNFFLHPLVFTDPLPKGTFEGENMCISNHENIW